MVPLSPTLCPGSRGRSTDPGPQLRHIHVMLSESTWAGHWGMPHLWKGSLSHWPSGDSYSLVPIPSGVQLCPVAFNCRELAFILLNPVSYFCFYFLSSQMCLASLPPLPFSCGFIPFSGPLVRFWEEGTICTCCQCTCNPVGSFILFLLIFIFHFFLSLLVLLKVCEFY